MPSAARNDVVRRVNPTKPRVSQVALQWRISSFVVRAFRSHDGRSMWEVQTPNDATAMSPMPSSSPNDLARLDRLTESDAFSAPPSEPRADSGWRAGRAFRVMPSLEAPDPFNEALRTLIVCCVDVPIFLATAWQGIAVGQTRAHRGRA